MTPKKVLNARVDDAMLEWLHRHAAAEKRSISSLVALALTQYVARVDRAAAKVQPDKPAPAAKGRRKPPTEPTAAAVPAPRGPLSLTGGAVAKLSRRTAGPLVTRPLVDKGLRPKPRELVEAIAPSKPLARREVHTNFKPEKKR